MAEYIEREVALKKIDTAIGEYAQHGEIVRFIGDCRASVIYAPAADVVEVVHGYWKTKSNIGGHIVMMRCSVCAFQFDNWRHIFDYCPVCGAKMDGDNK